jgi:hypothetical protein
MDGWTDGRHIDFSRAHFLKKYALIVHELRKKTYLSTYTKKIVQFVGNIFSKPQYSLIKSIGRQQEVPGIYKQREANGVPVESKENI